MTSEALDGLIELQDVDQSLRRLQHQLEHLPEQQELDDLGEVVANQAGEVSAVRSDLDQAARDQRKLEHELDLLRTRRDDEQARMYGGSITNPRELQSLRAELASTERRIGEYEDRLLEVMEAVETLEGRAALLQGRIDELDADLARLTDRRDGAAQGLLAERAEAQVARDRLRADLPADLVRRYDEAAGRSGGVAVGRLEAGMCTVCRIELPMAEVNELRAGPPLATCPNCRRLLVVGQ